MSSNINLVVISGNLTRDPELREAGQTNVLAFGVAVNDRRKNAKTDEWEDVPNFIDCNLFGKRAEALSDILHKGDKVTVFGKLHYSSWEKDGNKRSKIDVTVSDVELMQRRDGNKSSSNTSNSYSQDAPRAVVPPQAPTPDVYDDSIPF